MKNIVIFGATSAIAQSVARLYAQERAVIYLLGRDESKLNDLREDLTVRGATQVHIKIVDLAALDSLENTVDSVWQESGGIDIALIAHGTLPNQAAMIASFAATQQALTVNALSYIALLTPLANRMEQRGSGSLVVMSSVAGDRGRQSNYVYGAAKATVSVFCQGLRNRLAAKGVQVLTVKPGFVDTPMTAAFPKGPLWAQPEAVAQDIYRAVQSGKSVLYTPFFWRYIMLVIQHIPEFIFKKLSL
jgi:decaprenylphospho-beta-D-erythro-pentofuranosid-2-ulose 2-reductase